MLKLDLNQHAQAVASTARARLSRVSAAQALDRRIELQAESSFNFTALLGNRVAAKASGATVTLTGFVRDEEERCLAIATAESLQNVEGVVDALCGEPGYAMDSDEGLVAKVRSRLMGKANVSVETIQVKVCSGVIVLRGEVDNPVRRMLIETIVSEIRGARTLRNRLEINPMALCRQKTVTVDDASITGLIKTELVLAGLEAQINTSNAIVVLSGLATDRSERSAIGYIAQSVRGVKWVTNEMTVL